MDPELRRQLQETGIPGEEAAELAELAVEIEQVPEVEPRKAWLHESRWRLLRRFDEQQEGRSGPPESPER
jgi:hypothetical protein